MARADRLSVRTKVDPCLKKTGHTYILKITHAWNGEYIYKAWLWQWKRLNQRERWMERGNYIKSRLRLTRSDKSEDKKKLYQHLYVHSRCVPRKALLYLSSLTSWGGLHAETVVLNLRKPGEIKKGETRCLLLHTSAFHNKRTYLEAKSGRQRVSQPCMSVKENGPVSSMVLTGLGDRGQGRT